MTVEEANYIVNHYYYYVLKFCGCYTPEAIIEQLREGLETVGRPILEDYEIRAAWLEKSLLLAYLLDAHGLTEHGGSVGGAWLAPKGKKLLAALQACNDGWWEDDSIQGWRVKPTRPGFESAEAEEAAFMKEWA